MHIQKEKKSRLAPSGIRTGGSLLLILALAACGGGSDDNPAAEAETPPVAGAPTSSVECKGYDGEKVTLKAKTITIRNNSKGTIYPVLATSQNTVNEWLQGCFRSADPYPTELVHKLYVNEGEGLPAGAQVTITLPLYSKLPQDRYITWWNGGRVVLADNNERLLNPDVDTKLATPKNVSCRGQGADCKLSTYSSRVQFPEDAYAQLSEFTFGASIVPHKQKMRLLEPENVGYNISYVDHVYLPVAIGPKNNPYIGYSGSTQSLAAFRNHLDSFLKTPLGKGWPVYNLNELKLPGGYNIFAQRSGTLPPGDNVPVKPANGFPPVLTVMQCILGQCTEAEKKSLHFGEAVQRMQNLWGSCVAWDGEDLSPYVTETLACPREMKDRMEVVKAFFVQNHKNYLALYKAGQCTGDKPQKPKFNYWEAMMHIYGWVPFNEGCSSGANALVDTSIPGWTASKVQSMYIHELQYNYQQDAVAANPKLTFNPSVKLIHEDLKMNAYGFSVDDAVGFMSELGDGLIFTVGGVKGLENRKQFDYADGFSLAMGVPASLDGKSNKSLLKKYGICALNQEAGDPDCLRDKQDVIMPANRQISGFRVGTVPSYPIKVRFTDLNDNVYTVVVNTKFAACTDDMNIAHCPSNRTAIVDKASCRVVDSSGKTHPRSADWCKNANPNQQREKQLTKNFLSYPAPVDLMP